jgi:hypothetical protein
MGLQTPIALENLTISRPEMQVGLTEIIPLGEIPTGYLNRYLAEREVRCAFCDNHTPHKKGFTARMADGRIALCGRDCAAKYFGQSVADRFEEQLDQQIARSARRRVVQRAVEGVPATLAMITPDLISMEKQGLHAAHALYMEFKESRLPMKLSDNGDLEITGTKRRWVEKEDENGQVRKVPIDDPYIISRIAGAALIRTAPYPVSRFGSATERLNVLASVKTLDGWNDKVVDQMAEKRVKIVHDLENVARFLGQCRRFFTKSNITALAEFAKTLNIPVETLALHTVAGGFELVVTRREFSFSKTGEPRDFRTSRYRLPDFSVVPSAEDLLKALQGG